MDHPSLKWFLYLTCGFIGFEKKLTYYHLFLTLIPLLFLNKFLIYPSGLFFHLRFLLGLVFTFRAFKDYSTDHH